jgi:hypothetical protein
MDKLEKFLTNQRKDSEPFDLYEIQPELIQAKSTIEKLLSRLCKDTNLAKEIYEASGDSVAVSIWCLSQAINCLEKIIVNTK